MTKLSPPNKFLYAKMHVAMADTQSHEFVHHLTIHMMMESVSIARNNYLGMSVNMKFVLSNIVHLTESQNKHINRHM